MKFDENQETFFKKVIDKALNVSVFNISETAKTAPSFQLKMKTINILTMEELIEKFQAHNGFDLCSVSQEINNEYHGKLGIIYSQQLFKDISMSVSKSKTTTLLKEFGSDEVLEIGNEIINSIALEFSNKLNLTFPTELPQYDIGTIKEIIPKDISLFLWFEINLTIENIASEESLSVFYSTKNLQMILDIIQMQVVTNV